MAGNDPAHGGFRYNMRFMINAYLLVFVGGGLGSMLRLAIVRCCAPLGWIFPLATFSSNFLSCLLLGVILGLRGRGALNTDFQYLLAVGFCGGFSTFSTFSMENLALAQQGQWAQAALNVLLSVAGGFIAVFVGLRLVA